MESIPKIIHYIWFGGKPLPSSALRFIDSWKKYFPEFEIKRWDENNFDVRSNPYTARSYDAGLYAFVSDYARYEILYREGGIYFDTDVEVIKDFNDILERGPFLGIEKDGDIVSVAPGLCMGAFPGMDFYREMIHFYKSLDSDKTELRGYLVSETTARLIEKGFLPDDREQTVAGITIYPNRFFNPLDDFTGRLNLTPDTRSIHYYAKTWIGNYGPTRRWLSRKWHLLSSLWKR